MTNQQGAPEALRLADSLELCWGDSRLDEAAAELRRLHAENERLAALVEAQQTATHVQNPAGIEHVAGDVSKNGAEVNMMDLIDEYAEARHLGGCHTYNAKTAEARAKVVAALRTQQPAPAYEAGWKDGYKHGAWSTQQPAPATQQAGWTNADADAARLALELECLLMDTKDTAVVSKWWQSANEALELHRARLQEVQPSPTAQAAESVPAVELPALFREALAWGMTYGPAIPAHQWDEMRESMVAQYTSRAARAPAESVGRDAARYRWLREQHEGDDAEETCCVFAPNDMRECLVPVGSLPGELDEFIDAALAAQREVKP